MTTPSVDVAVCIPTIPSRFHLLNRAVGSVHQQTVRPRQIVVSGEDPNNRLGAPANRNRALFEAQTEWVAFLDDDDEFERWHLEKCLAHAQETGADVVYPWVTVVGGHDPLGWENRPFDEAALRRSNYIPITVLARRELLVATGGFRDSTDVSHIGSTTPGATCEDWTMWLALLDLGAKFSHLPSRTWRWYHHGANTQGCSDRW